MDFLLSLIKSLHHQDILSDLGVSVEDVSYAIRDNFDKLPSNIREELLLKLAGKDTMAVIFRL